MKKFILLIIIASLTILGAANDEVKLEYENCLEEFNPKLAKAIEEQTTIPRFECSFIMNGKEFKHVIDNGLNIISFDLCVITILGPNNILKEGECPSKFDPTNPTTITEKDEPIPVVDLIGCSSRFSSTNSLFKEPQNRFVTTNGIIDQPLEKCPVSKVSQTYFSYRQDIKEFESIGCDLEEFDREKSLKYLDFDKFYSVEYLTDESVYCFVDVSQNCGRREPNNEINPEKYNFRNDQLRLLNKDGKTYYYSANYPTVENKINVAKELYARSQNLDSIQKSYIENFNCPDDVNPSVEISCEHDISRILTKIPALEMKFRSNGKLNAIVESIAKDDTDESELNFIVDTQMREKFGKDISFQIAANENRKEKLSKAMNSLKNKEELNEIKVAVSKYCEDNQPRENTIALTPRKKSSLEDRLNAIRNAKENTRANWFSNLFSN